jgi:hypothetical protein
MSRSWNPEKTDELDAAEFFHRTWGGFLAEKKHQAVLELRYSRGRTLEDGPVLREWGTLGRLNDWIGRCEGLKLSTPHSLHFAVCPRSSQAGKKLAVIGASCVWADVDHFSLRDYADRLRPSLAGAGIEPAVVMSSGWGTYFFWTFTATVTNLPTLERLNRFMAWLCGGDTQSVEGARVLRYPGSYNCKAVPFRRSRAFAGGGRPQDPAEFADRMSWLAAQYSRDPERAKSLKEAVDGSSPAPSGARRTGKRRGKAIPADQVRAWIKEQSSNCPFLGRVMRQPDRLSYSGWLTLAALIYRLCGDVEEAAELFSDLSSLDQRRFEDDQVVQRWERTVQEDMMPHGCGKLDDASGCSRKRENTCRGVLSLAAETFGKKARKGRAMRESEFDGEE